MDDPPEATGHSHTTFAVSLSICVALAAWATFAPDQALPVLQQLGSNALDSVGDLFVIVPSALLVALVALAASPLGKRRLGAPDTKPDFSTPSWLSMLFAAGMGTGLVVWGIAEPVTHALKPPSSAMPADTMAFVITNFHWGLHAWAIYAAGALVLAYFGFVHGTNYLPSSPLVREFKGPRTKRLASAVDVLAIVAVVFGVAGSIAMGTMLVHSGLTELLGVSPTSAAVDWAILGVLFVAYMASSATGLDKGIRILSNLNMVAAFGLLIALIVLAGPAASLTNIAQRTGEYIAALPALCLTLNPFEASRGWYEGWTLIYMVWWVAWTPFVGIFIARISRGRTIREFVLGVLVVPPLFSIIWFGAYGQVGLDAAATDPATYAALADSNATAIMFRAFETLPATTLLSTLATILVSIFLITSVDSATFVLGMLTSGGALTPPASRKWSWGVVLGILGTVFALTRNTDTIKALVVAGSVPFLGILMAQCLAFGRALVRDAKGDATDSAA
ncbi:MAG: BCCT family transporter [Myxococcota bacterium]|nr:BCCT family transporter [Myxococcota bacterium]